jgi:hypothetical protein
MGGHGPVGTIAALGPECQRRLADVIRNAVRLFEGKDPLPIVLHADDSPAVLSRLVVECRSEGAELAVAQAASRTVGVFAGGIAVQKIQ